jgi:hypothetical protein
VDQVAVALLRFLAGRLQPLLLGQVLHDHEQARRLLVGQLDRGQADPHRLGVPSRVDVQLVEPVLLGYAGVQHLARVAHEALGPHQLLQVAPEHVVVAQAKRL